MYDLPPIDFCFYMSGRFRHQKTLSIWNMSWFCYANRVLCEILVVKHGSESLNRNFVYWSIIMPSSQGNLTFQSGENFSFTKGFKNLRYTYSLQITKSFTHLCAMLRPAEIKQCCISGGRLSLIIFTKSLCLEVNCFLPPSRIQAIHIKTSKAINFMTIFLLNTTSNNLWTTLLDLIMAILCNLKREKKFKLNACNYIILWTLKLWWEARIMEINRVILVIKISSVILVAVLNQL